MEQNSVDPTFVLLVDADAAIAEAVRSALADTGLELLDVKTIAEAMERLGKDVPRLILSELSLSDGSGFSLCRLVRESPKHCDVPVVLVSHWSLESDRILAFECGADDFLAKPFFERELSSRIKAVLRRSAAPIQRDEPGLSDGSSLLTIDEDRREVRFDGAALPLTPREFALLATLARHRGRVLSRPDLISEAWSPGENPTERSVDAHVKSLRRKLATAKDAIETVRGLGYRYSEKNLARGAGRP